MCMYRPIEAEIWTLNRIGCSKERKTQDFQRDPMGIPTRSPAMRMGKKRLTEKAYTNGTLGRVERGRERENENGNKGVRFFGRN